MKSVVRGGWGYKPSSDHCLLLLAVCSASFYSWGFPVVQQWRICLQCGRPGFDTWVGKIPWRRKWQPTPAFLPGKSRGQRSLAGYNPFVLIATNYYFMFAYILTYLLSCEFLVDKNLIIENKVFVSHMLAMKASSICISRTLKDAHFD